MRSNPLQKKKWDEPQNTGMNGVLSVIIGNTYLLDTGSRP